MSGALAREGVRESALVRGGETRSSVVVREGEMMWRSKGEEGDGERGKRLKRSVLLMSCLMGWSTRDRQLSAAPVGADGDGVIVARQSSKSDRDVHVISFRFGGTVRRDCRHGGRLDQ